MSAPAKPPKPRWLESKLKGVQPLWVGVIYAGLGIVTILFVPHITLYALVLLVYTSPLWLFIVVPKSIDYYWIHYAQHQFTAGPKTKGVLLEIRLPREIHHSPRAMELVFEALHFTPQMGTKFLTKWHGHVAPWYSLEIASIRGELKFYIWCWESTQTQVEAAFYAQYPTIQIVPTEYDYAVEYVRAHQPARTINAWGNALRFEKDDAYPIKTYYDFQLEQDPKAELKIDPFVTVLEQMSSNGPNEILWLQILFQPENSNAWKKKAMEEIQKIYDKTKKSFKNAKGEEQPGYSQLKPMEFEIVRAMERSTMKHGFKVAIRAIVIFEDGKFNNVMTQALNFMFKPLGMYGNEFFNSLRPDGEKHTNGFDYPWEFKEWTRPPRVQAMFDAYAARAAFAPPHIEDAMIMTTEALATLFHLPGEEAQQISIKRIESTQKGAPANLPI